MQVSSALRSASSSKTAFKIMAASLGVQASSRRNFPQRLNQSGVSRTPVYRTHRHMKGNQTIPIFLSHLGHSSHNILPFWFYRVFLLLMVLLYHKGLNLSTPYIGLFIIYPNIIISAAKNIASRKWFFIIAVTYWIVKQMARTIMIKVVMLVPPAVERGIIPSLPR